MKNLFLKLGVLSVLFMMCIFSQMVYAATAKIDTTGYDNNIKALISTRKLERNTLQDRFMKDQLAVEILFFNIYDMYDTVVEYEQALNEQKSLYKYSNSSLKNTRILNKLSYYDMNFHKNIYATVPKDRIQDFQKIRFNLVTLKNESNGLFNGFKSEYQGIKDNKKNYSKEDFQALKRVYKSYGRSVKNISKLSKSVDEVASINGIKSVYSANGDYYQYSARYGQYPNRLSLENEIIAKNKNKSNNYQVKYYEKVYGLRQGIIPVLADLLLTT